MSFASAKSAIRSHFDTGWSSASRSEPVKHENKRFTEPTTPWVSLVSREVDEGTQVTVGINNAIHRYFGNIIVQVFQPENWDAASDEGGDTDGLALCDVVRSIFLGANSESLVINVAANHNIYCKPPALVTVGHNNGWFQQNVVTVYRRDVIG